MRMQFMGSSSHVQLIDIYMMTSSIGNFFALLVLCEGNPSINDSLPGTSRWRGALKFSLICAWAKIWANNRDAGDLWHHYAHYAVALMGDANLFITGSSNGLSPSRCQAITLNQWWRIGDRFLINRLQWNFNQNTNVSCGANAVGNIVRKSWCFCSGSAISIRTSKHSKEFSGSQR